MLRTTLIRRIFAASTAAPPRRSSFSAFTSPPVSPSAAASSASSPSSCSSSSSTVAAELEGEDDDDYVSVKPTVSSSQSKAAAAATLPTLLQPRVVIYDGVCHLCHRGVKWVIKVDKYAKIKFCCLQSKAAEPYLRLCGVDREDVLRRFLFIEGPEAYHEGSTAALKVASYLPMPYSALSALLVVPAPLRDEVYDYVAKHRYDWFGKEDECIIMRQDHELLDRFIDRDEMFNGDGDNHFF